MRTFGRHTASGVVWGTVAPGVSISAASAPGLAGPRAHILTFSLGDGPRPSAGTEPFGRPVVQRFGTPIGGRMAVEEDSDPGRRRSPWSCWGRRRRQRHPGQPQQDRGPDRKAARRDLVSIVSASGEVKPKRYVNIGANVSGRIAALAGQGGRRGQAGARCWPASSPSATRPGKRQSEAGVQAREGRPRPRAWPTSTSPG